MKRVLCIDGGGAKGVIPAVVLAELEDKLGDSISNIFDLIVGSSVGAILGSIYAHTSYSAETIKERLVKEIPYIFKKRLRIPIFMPKYDAAKVIDVCHYLYGVSYPCMKDVNTRFMCSSVNMVFGRTHFFKSWDPDDRLLNLLNVVHRSFAAPLYFGSVVDRDRGAVWLDGGTGLDNCPLQRTFNEILNLGWMEEKVHIFSLGCGYSDKSMSFKEAAGFKNLMQVFYYMNPANGGLARTQSTKDQVYFLERYQETFENITFQRLDREIPKKQDVLDGVKYLTNYQLYGEVLAKQINYDLFKE